MADMIRRYRININGVQPLLMHPDDIEWADQMERWKNDKDNKKTGKAGDDRSPAWRWVGNLYHDGNVVVMPIENIMRCLMEGGAMVLVPGGRSGKTFKAQTQSGIMPTSAAWPVLVDGKPVAFEPFKALIGNKDFEAHKQAAADHGFELFLKRAKIGANKHVRVRPRFDRWAISGELVVTDEQITTDVLSDILESAGRYKGLGDWRPGSKTPGAFGIFEAAVVPV
jgi:hypothetical protein